MRQALDTARGYAFIRAEAYTLAGAHQRLCGRTRAERKWLRRAIAQAQHLDSRLDETRAREELARLNEQRG